MELSTCRVVCRTETRDRIDQLVDALVASTPRRHSVRPRQSTNRLFDGVDRAIERERQLSTTGRSTERREHA